MKIVRAFQATFRFKENKAIIFAIQTKLLSLPFKQRYYLCYSNKVQITFNNSIPN
jgi:hypothetical protein